MQNRDGFTMAEIEQAFKAASEKCECCGKQLHWEKSQANPGHGQWEAHRGERTSPVILCAGGSENCHLNCGHEGNFQNPGILPQAHKAG